MKYQCSKRLGFGIWNSADNVVAEFISASLVGMIWAGTSPAPTGDKS
jgi:hypothetical protein